MTPQGTVRFDPVTGSVAIRTNQPETTDSPFGTPMAWLVATQTMGARFVGPDVVADWIELNTGS